MIILPPTSFPLLPFLLKVCTNMLKVLYLKGNSMQVLLKRIVPTALTLTCSKQLRFDDEEGPVLGFFFFHFVLFFFIFLFISQYLTGGEESKPYLHYLSLWRHFLNPWRKQSDSKPSTTLGRSPSEFEDLKFPPETQFHFRCLIFNEVMEVKAQSDTHTSYLLI